MRRTAIQTFYFESYSDDLVTSKNQNFELPRDFIWAHDSLPYKAISTMLYGLGLAFAFPYCHVRFSMRVNNREVLDKADSGFFLFANHTQPVGDAFAPACAVFPKRTYVLVSPSNLGIPVLGKLLPAMGALPTPDCVSGMKKLKAAIARRIEQGHCVVIYPEAHVWPWYTKIRPFPSSSFAFPSELGAPSFCMTTTYRARAHGLLPQSVIYIDGPFYPDMQLSKRARRDKLCEQVRTCMIARSGENDCEHVHYVQKAHSDAA